MINRKVSSFSARTRELLTRIDNSIVDTKQELEIEILNIVEGELRFKCFSPLIDRQRKIVWGLQDARMGGLIFGFEKPVKKDTTKDLENAKTLTDHYMTEYRGKDITLRGILTNGFKIIFVDEEKNIVESGNFGDCLLTMEKWISNLVQKDASSTDLKRQLGPVWMAYGIV